MAEGLVSYRTVKGCSDVLSSAMERLQQPQPRPAMEDVRSSFIDAVKYLESYHGPSDSIFLKSPREIQTHWANLGSESPSCDASQAPTLGCRPTQPDSRMSSPCIPKLPIGSRAQAAAVPKIPGLPGRQQVPSLTLTPKKDIHTPRSTPLSAHASSPKTPSTYTYVKSARNLPGRPFPSPHQQGNASPTPSPGRSSIPRYSPAHAALQSSRTPSPVKPPLCPSVPNSNHSSLSLPSQDKRAYSQTASPSSMQPALNPLPCPSPRPKDTPEPSSPLSPAALEDCQPVMGSRSASSRRSGSTSPSSSCSSLGSDYRDVINPEDACPPSPAANRYQEQLTPGRPPVSPSPAVPRFPLTPGRPRSAAAVPPVPSLGGSQLIPALALSPKKELFTPRSQPLSAHAASPKTPSTLSYVSCSKNMACKPSPSPQQNGNASPTPSPGRASLPRSSPTPTPSALQSAAMTSSPAMAPHSLPRAIPEEPLSLDSSVSELSLPSPVSPCVYTHTAAAAAFPTASTGFPSSLPSPVPPAVLPHPYSVYKDQETHDAPTSPHSSSTSPTSSTCTSPASVHLPPESARATAAPYPFPPGAATLTSSYTPEIQNLRLDVPASADSNNRNSSPPSRSRLDTSAAAPQYRLSRSSNMPSPLRGPCEPPTCAASQSGRLTAESSASRRLHQSGLLLHSPVSGTVPPGFAPVCDSSDGFASPNSPFLPLSSPLADSVKRMGFIRSGSSRQSFGIAAAEAERPRTGIVAAEVERPRTARTES